MAAIEDESLPQQIDGSILHEQTPLLAHENENGNGPDARNSSKDDDRPLDKVQILILSYSRMMDSLGFFCIVPFINQMIFDTGDYPESSVGFYSGLIVGWASIAKPSDAESPQESLFSMTQMLFMIPWGRLSDRYGRKPVLLSSLTGMSIAVAMFGFSQKLWHMILLRCLAGIFSGSVV
jgi:MFS family permease